MTPEQQSQSFLSTVFNTESALASAVEWIAANMQPQEIYDRSVLEDWARLNGWIPPQE